MTEQCKVVGSTIEPCGAMNQLIAGNIAGFKFQTFRQRDTDKCRVAVVIEKSSKNKLEICYCPACGGNIKTDYAAQAKED